MKDTYKNRSLVLKIVVLAFSIILLGKLFHLQVFDPSYKDLAQRNVIKKVKTYPTRGLIYDRNGDLLVYNQAVFDIEVVPRQVKQIDTLLLCNLLGISKKYFIDKMQKLSKGINYYSSNEFLKQVSAEKYAAFKENSYQFPGFYGSTRTIRKYPFSNAGHLLGNIGEVDSIQIKASNNYYKPRDYVGKSGLELIYESDLRGEVGHRYIFIDKFYNEQGSFKDGAEDKLPVQGKSLKLSIDVKLQQYGEQLLKNKVGSIVAIQPSTGEVLALVTSPSIDPNLLTGRERSDNYTKLLLNPLKPLFNRATMAQYPPGSTFKPLVALIGLQENAIHENFGHTCGGVYHIPGYTLKCSHGHPSARNVQQAIQHSCNPYFWQVFRNTIENPKYPSPRDSYEKWTEYANKFSLNQPTGIDLESEKSGNVPRREYYNNLYGERGWRATTIISLGIGQGEILTTPLQLANLFTVFANRGYYYTPHIVKEIDGETPPQVKKIESGIAPQHFEVIAEGLKLVVDEGTGRRSKIPQVSFGGKTGTAQNPHGDDHSIFAGFAPVEKPEIVVAVVVENAGGGSRFAAPLASFMIEMYLHDSIADSRKLLEQQILETDLIEKLLLERRELN